LSQITKSRKDQRENAIEIANNILPSNAFPLLKKTKKPMSNEMIAVGICE
jgi:hypothetical protein